MSKKIVLPQTAPSSSVVSSAHQHGANHTRRPPLGANRAKRGTNEISATFPQLHCTTQKANAVVNTYHFEKSLTLQFRSLKSKIKRRDHLKRPSRSLACQKVIHHSIQLLSVVRFKVFHYKESTTQVCSKFQYDLSS